MVFHLNIFSWFPNVCLKNIKKKPTTNDDTTVLFLSISELLGALVLLSVDLSIWEDPITIILDNLFIFLIYCLGRIHFRRTSDYKLENQSVDFSEGFIFFFVNYIFKQQY